MKNEKFKSIFIFVKNMWFLKISIPHHRGISCFKTPPHYCYGDKCNLGKVKLEIMLASGLLHRFGAAHGLIQTLALKRFSSVF